MQLTEQDINNALAFLNRVDLKGNESMAMTDVQIKLRQMLHEMQNPPADPPADPPKGKEK